MTAERGALSSTETRELTADIRQLRAQLSGPSVDSALLVHTLDSMEDFLGWAEHSREQLEQQERVHALYRVSQMLSSSLDLQMVLDSVMDAITELTQADRAFLMLRDDDGTVAVRAARNLDQQTLSAEHFKYSRSVVDTVLDTGEAAVTTNAASDPRFRDSPSIVNQQLRFIAAVPLRLRDRVIGVVYADSRSPRALAGSDVLPMLEAFAAQAAVAIDHAHLFSSTGAALTARIEELQQLRRIDFQLNESLNEDHALQMTLGWLVRLCHADAGCVALPDDKDAAIRFVTGEGAHLRVDMPLTHTWPQAHDVISTHRSFCFSQNGASVALLPIVHEAETLAVIALQRNPGARGPFSAEEIDLAERILARAAVAIDNARLHAAVIAADETKTEFVGIVAHDLRSPMGTILAYADLTLLTGTLDAEQTDYIERIRDTIYRVDKLISDLADISRIESGHFSIETARINPIELMAELRDTMHSQVAARRHRWVEQIAPNLPDIEADFYRLLQVLTNLVSNAAKYTPDGGVITVSAQMAQGELAPHIVFTVVDNGIGMSAATLARLGARFWRASDSFTRTQPGSGLGFYIARRLVQQMGSEILVDSAPGRGSRFSFTVPVWRD
ncbi:MAG TPA: ATP-binding protein [Candidatus Limnocylindrales bacterium]|nr:ATP-binding protein [Candidatus Limnocylindrales bacterium]